MSLEREDRNMSDQPNESTCETKRRLKISYSREFLLSLSGLEICKKLPSGYDESIMSDFENPYSDFENPYKERQRLAGSFSSHGYRRNEYGSSSPTKGELNDYSQGINGRWESRSSGRSDKDTDSQYDRDSDSGKRYINPSRRGWQAPEHDGLLGSGSFPRPSGYAPGASAPKYRPNDNYRLNRSTEPYNPPRPYKGVPHQRKETNDSYNDETFGSLECMSEDKAEEERKRRASFELMRKEQQKAFQERQKLNQERRRDDFDITALLEDSGHEKRTFHKNNEVDEKAIAQECISDPTKSSLSSMPVPRPLVPPGFAGALHERKSDVIEVKVVSEGNISSASDSILASNPSEVQEVKQVSEKIGLSMKQHGSTDIHMILSGDSEKNVSSVLDVSIQPLNRKDLFENHHLSNVMEPSSTSEMLGVHPDDTAGSKTMVQSSNSTTVLEKLFGGTLTLDASGSSTVLKQHGPEEDTWSPRTVQSSRFARWFVEEDEKPSVHPVSSQPNELLSLIVSGEKSASSDAQASDKLWSNSLFLGSQPAEGHIASSSAIAATNKSGELFTEGKTGAAPAVLTCEDLENSILSEISESGTKQQQQQQQQPLQGWAIDAEVNGAGSGVNNCASLHLLSLLKKGTDHGDALLFPNVNAKVSENPGSVESEIVVDESGNPNEPTCGNLPNLGKNLTLEALFGTAFMRELQSVGAPVSAQSGPGSAGSAKLEAMDPQAFPFTQIEANVRSGSETGGLTLNQRQRSDLEKLDKQSVLGDLQTDLDIPQIKTEARLFEEDSSLTVNEPLNHRGLMLGSGAPSRAEGSSSQTTPHHMAEKLVALDGNLREKFIRGQGHPAYHVPLNERELDLFQTLYLQQSSPQLHPQQFNPMGTNFRLLDSYPGHHDPQMKLMAQDFHGNMIRPPIQHPGTGFTGFDPPSHHHSMLQQMHITGKFPPVNQFQGFMGGPQVPPHPNDQLPGFNHKMNPMQGLHFGAHNQPKFSGADIPHPAPNMGEGNNHPEALQRLIEMELRNTSAKQMRQVAAAGGGDVHLSQGAYGPELDLGFRYK